MPDSSGKGDNMPTPKKGEKKDDFMARCIPIVMGGGKSKDEAAAQCNDIWDQHQEKGRAMIDRLSFSSTLLSHAWAILPAKIEEILSSSRIVDLNQEAFVSLFDFEADDEHRRYQIEDGIAILNIYGSITKEMDLFMMLFGGGGTGTKLLIQDFKAALEDDDVKGIMFDIDSPGGRVDATVEMADLVYESRGIKPILTFAQDMASAAYWIGSGADHLVVENVATQVGSIGIVTILSEISKAAERAGEKFTVFSSGKYKAAGNRYEPLDKDNRSYIQGMLDYNYSLFIDAVARNRGVSTGVADKQMSAGGKIFIGQQALDAGLVDGIANREQAMALLKSVASGDAEFSKDSTAINTKVKLGGETLMTPEELQAEITRLEGLLAERDTALSKAAGDLEAQKSTVVVDGLNTEITDLKAQVAYMIEAGTAQDAVIQSMKDSMSGDAKMCEVGKQTLEALKADIKAVSAQVHGDDYDEAFTTQQIDAMAGGEDSFDALTKMKANLEITRKKIFKTGKLSADGVEKTDVKDMSDDAKRQLGSKLGHGQVIPITKNQ